MAGSGWAVATRSILGGLASSRRRHRRRPRAGVSRICHNSHRFVRLPPGITHLNDSRRSLIAQCRNDLSATLRHTASEILAGIVRMSATRTNYWLEFAFTGALATALFAAGVRLHRGSWLTAFLAVMVGLIVFSFIEYVFHRWLFHGPDSMYRRGHDAHHRDPHGYDALPFFLPSAIVLGLTAVFAL